MKIATYNVNSINARIENLCQWLKNTDPDIVLLQEIKTEFNNFPFFEINTLGYDVKILGQKSYNGVAILSKYKIAITLENLPEFMDEQSRYLEALIKINNTRLRVASVYLPNGNPPYNDINDTSKFSYKLQWMDAFSLHLKKLVHSEEPVIIGGDFNIILSDNDVYDPNLFRGNALFRPEVINRLKAIEYTGWTDAFRMGQIKSNTLSQSQENGYTYWDYAGGAFASDLGLRIDYLMLSPKAADKLEKCWVDKSPRRASKPSDHTPLIADINLI